MKSSTGLRFKTTGITIIFLLASLLFITISCEESKKSETKQEVKENVELCQGDYLTEEQGAEKLIEYAKTYSNAKEWKARAAKIKHQIIHEVEIDKIPKKDFNYSIKVVHGAKHQMNGYTVENIALEARPGYFITGNLYLPENIKEKIPVILNPHGHWDHPDDYGRFRPDMQYRCAVEARMGAAAFAYDMTGFGENKNSIHFDPRALNLQTYNGIRILDYFSSLDYVDTTRIGMTGASGGGTQTFVLSAIDHRIDVSAPIVMVSAHFFGGCVCESGMPIHKTKNFETNNVEIAASFAPKPLMLVADGDDWTKNSETVEFPYIEHVYKLFNATQNFEHAFFANEVHNYGISKRKAVYPFLAKHLKLNYQNILDGNGQVDESFVQLLDTTALKVYPDNALVKKPTPW